MADELEDAGEDSDDSNDEQADVGLFMDKMMELLQISRDSYSEEVAQKMVDRLIDCMGGMKNLEEIPEQLVTAFLKYVPDAEDVVHWNVDAACNFVKVAGEKLKNIATHPNVEESQRQIIHIPDDHFERLRLQNERYQNRANRASPFVIRTESPEVQLTAGSQCTPSVLDEEPDVVVKREPTSDDENTEKDEDGEVAEEVALIPETEKKALEMELVAKEKELNSAQREAIELKISICQNYLFDRQADITDLYKLSSTIPLEIVDLASAIPYWNSEGALAFADDFPGRPIKPLIDNISLYLRVVLFDVGSTKDLPVRRRDSERHLIWLGTKVHSILANGQEQDFRVFQEIIRIFIHELKVGGFALSCLLVLVANLTQRSGDTQTNSLWWEMYQQLFADVFGDSEEGWGFTNRVCFAWFMSTGSDQDMNGFLAHRAPTFEHVIEQLKVKTPQDFANLLFSSAIAELAEQDGPSTNLIKFRISSHVRMAIVRECLPDSGLDVEEQIWTKFDGKVVFSDRGLEFKYSIDNDGAFGLLVSAKLENGEAPWFPVDPYDKMTSEYLEAFYGEDIDHVLDEYKKGVETR